MYSGTLATMLIPTLFKNPKTESSFVTLVTVAFCLQTEHYSIIITPWGPAYIHNIKF
jgi:hypothetical protein